MRNISAFGVGVADGGVVGNDDALLPQESTVEVTDQVVDLSSAHHVATPVLPAHLRRAWFVTVSITHIVTVAAGAIEKVVTTS